MSKKRNGSIRYNERRELEKNGIMEETVNPDCKRFRKC